MNQREIIEIAKKIVDVSNEPDKVFIYIGYMRKAIKEYDQPKKEDS